MVKEIIKSKPLTLAEVKTRLTKRSKKAELSYIQRVTLDHTTKFSSLPSRTARSLVKKLIKKYDMEDALAIQLVNIIPTTSEELASFLARAPRTYTPDEVSDILELLVSAMKKGASKKKK